MYQINMGDSLVILAKSEEVQFLPGFFDGVEHQGDLDVLKEWMEKAMQGDVRENMLVLHHADLQLLWNDICKCLKVHKAGGGVVFNKEDKILAIYRRGFWDLPKGKQDPGETIEDTAIREVQEETGVQNLTLGDFITDTYHVYLSRKGKMILKWSVWYKMYTEEAELTPQTEEDIEEAVWLSKEELLEKKPIYNNILYVIKKL